jgi:hypothetical protein
MLIELSGPSKRCPAPHAGHFLFPSQSSSVEAAPLHGYQMVSAVAPIQANLSEV